MSFFEILLLVLMIGLIIYFIYDFIRCRRKDKKEEY